ncbi:hypothetical protein [uncultured Oscillibacter sp.]|uniref:hypothetical protein n=1 Tax=uncultured Oscillibacter sp. TaxID=876091 RepID=UPI002615AC1D|nr:hypothetical protein [uncultured Oscillibacter sp.]
MISEEIGELYICIAFQYESALDQLVGKGLIDKDFADKHKKAFTTRWMKKSYGYLKRLEVIKKSYAAI